MEVTQNECTDTSACIDILTVNTEPITNATGITISPNPAKDKMTITAPEQQINGPFKVSITDFQGRVMANCIYQNNSNTIDISGIARGLYFVRISYKGSDWFTKIIKD